MRVLQVSLLRPGHPKSPQIHLQANHPYFVSAAEYPERAGAFMPLNHRRNKFPPRGAQTVSAGPEPSPPPNEIESGHPQNPISTPNITNLPESLINSPRNINDPPTYITNLPFNVTRQRPRPRAVSSIQPLSNRSTAPCPKKVPPDCVELFPKSAYWDQRWKFGNPSNSRAFPANSLESAAKNVPNVRKYAAKRA